MNGYIAMRMKGELKSLFIYFLMGVGILAYGKYLNLGKFVLPFLLPLLYGIKIHASRLRRLISGAHGEEEVARKLHKHLRDHRIFQNVYTGRGDIDVIIVGEGGVFIVEIKKFKHKVTAGKNSVKYGRKELLNQLERNEEYVRGLIAREGLHAPINSYLLVLGKARGRNPRLVHNTKELIKKIRSKPILSSEQVRDIAALFSK